MNIILVSDNLAGRKHITLDRNQVIMLMLGWMLLPIFVALGLYYFTLSSGIGSFPQNQPQSRVYLQENLNAMAARLGQLQAQMLRLDALGGRLAKHHGLPEQEFNFQQKPGQGGTEPGKSQFSLTPQQLELELAQFGQRLEGQADRMSIFESLTLREQLTKNVFPSLHPISHGWFSSNFGWRIDPITGKQAMHEGVDFMAETGADIKAAAGGVVVYSDYHPQYGNMIDVDHGNGLVSRYAHASKRLARQGDIVLPGQKIAEVGNTGRSTGPHLHFEILSNGIPQNPARYLRSAG